MIYKCANCDREFEVRVFGLVGPEGATSGIYNDVRSVGFLYNPGLDIGHPFCPHCEFVDISVEIELRSIEQ